jgi:hypothetical protein
MIGRIVQGLMLIFKHKSSSMVPNPLSIPIDELDNKDIRPRNSNLQTSKSSKRVRISESSSRAK